MSCEGCARRREWLKQQAAELKARATGKPAPPRQIPKRKPLVA